MAKTVTHLIAGLGKGGAETMLYQVLKYRTDRGTAHQVVSLGGARYYEGPIRELGVPVTELAFRTRPASGLLRLVKLLRGTDTLCCWMYHANFVGWIAGRLARVPRVVWCIRHPTLDPALNKKLTLRISAFCAKRSSQVAAVTYNGEKARAVHEAAGYCSEKSVVLVNGCDCEEYIPNPNAAAEIRQELGLSPAQRILLSVTRDHPGKDVPTFLAAVALLRRERPDIVGVSCGSGIEPANIPLAEACASNGLTFGKDIFLLGQRHDVPQLLAACDVYALHSAEEAFPNTLLQAMSCGCLCAATDVGDVKHILPDGRWIIPPGSADILAEKIIELLELPPEAAQNIRAQNRRTVREKFDIRQIVKQYEALF